MTEAEIKAPYENIHSLLEVAHYVEHKLTLEEHTFLHGQNWDDMETELIAKGYIKPPKQRIDYEAEIYELKAEMKKLKEKK